MKQLSFLPEIDREATKEAVERVLEMAGYYKRYGFMRREMAVTPAYSPRYHGATNAVGNPLQDVAAYNVDRERELEDNLERVKRAVRRLPQRERRIIELLWLDPETERCDYEVAKAMHYSDRHYRRIKGSAYMRLAFILRLEVYVAEDAV